MELPQLRDHLSLASIEPGIVDRHRDLIGEGREQALIVSDLPSLVVGDADHSDDRHAHPEGDAQEGADPGVPSGLPDSTRIVLDVVGDVRALLGNGHAQDAGADRHAPEPVVEAGVRRPEPFDGTTSMESPSSTSGPMKPISESVSSKQ
jgi:hypothetical protein